MGPKVNVKAQSANDKKAAAQLVKDEAAQKIIDKVRETIFLFCRCCQP
jgi:hypothetical protein